MRGCPRATVSQVSSCGCSGALPDTCCPPLALGLLPLSLQAGALAAWAAHTPASRSYGVRRSGPCACGTWKEPSSAPVGIHFAAQAERQPHLPPFHHSNPTMRFFSSVSLVALAVVVSLVTLVQASSDPEITNSVRSRHIPGSSTEAHLLTLPHPRPPCRCSSRSSTATRM